MVARKLLAVLVALPALFAVTAVAQEPGAATPACVPAAEAASNANLTRLVGAVQSLTTYPEAQTLVTAATSSAPVDPPVTIFAPTDDAFAAIDSLGPLDEPTLFAVLATHVLPGAVDSKALLAAIDLAAPQPYVAETLSGDLLEFARVVDDDDDDDDGVNDVDDDDDDDDGVNDVDDDDGMAVIVKVQGSTMRAAVLLQTDVPTCAGPVHVISRVLVPNEVAATLNANSATSMGPRGDDDGDDGVDDAADDGDDGADDADDNGDDGVDDADDQGDD